MVSVTTDALPAHERAEFWADLVSRHMTPIRSDAGRIARDIGVSSRTLARIFADKDETVMPACSMSACARPRNSLPRRRALAGQSRTSPLPAASTTCHTSAAHLPAGCT